MPGTVINFLKPATTTALQVMLLCCLHTLCRSQDIVFNHLSVENGLSQISVLSLAQDNRGFIWFGTRNGLNRYDGSRFKIYRNEATDTKSLSSSIFQPC